MIALTALVNNTLLYNSYSTIPGGGSHKLAGSCSAIQTHHQVALVLDHTSSRPAIQQ